MMPGSVELQLPYDADADEDEDEDEIPYLQSYP